MRKAKLILCVTILFSMLTGCSTKEETNNHTNIQLLLSNENNFRLELLEIIHEYRVILQFIVDDQERENIEYLEGRIDGFLSRNNQTIYSTLNQDNINKTTLDAIVRDELQKPLSRFISLMFNSLTEIKNIGIDKLDDSYIKYYDSVLSLLEVFDHAPSNLFTDENSSKSKEILTAIHSIIERYEGNH